MILKLIIWITAFVLSGLLFGLFQMKKIAVVTGLYLIAYLIAVVTGTLTDATLTDHLFLGSFGWTITMGFAMLHGAFDP